MLNKKRYFGTLNMLKSKHGRGVACSFYSIACFIFVTSADAQTIDRLDTIGPFIDRCMTPKMAEQRFVGRREVTFRVSFRTNGSIIADVAQTFSFPNAAGVEQKQFITAVKQAFVACTPLPFSKELGAAIAGRPYSYRYVHQPSKDIAI
jgi:hypothetical protein